MATDFSSLDKLVEFGLGVGIASQMMNTMQSVIARTAVPGVGINPGAVTIGSSSPGGAGGRILEAPLVKSYFIVKDEHVAGPLNEQELSILVKKGVVARDTFCWSPGMKGWNLAECIPEINKLILLNGASC